LPGVDTRLCTILVDARCSTMLVVWSVHFRIIIAAAAIP
jgi:hypothetical protein